MVKLEKEVPWCTVALVIAALTCHSIVLYGNFETASALEDLGASTMGWSKVGLGLSRSLREELNVLMGEVEDGLAEALNHTVHVHKYLDAVVSMVGNETERASTQAVVLLQLPDGAATLPDSILSGVTQTLENVLAKLSAELDAFLVKITPALKKVGQMVLKFGSKITQVLESFSLTLDNVVKVFDHIMVQVNAGRNASLHADMVNDTFALFDVSNTGLVSVDDLSQAGAIYAISALQGAKPKDLVEKYDRDGNMQLDKEEFSLFVGDESIPNSMAVILRAYAKRLAVVAGNVGSAINRGEVSLAVTKYFQLVCAKNKTKLGWVADALGNGSLPLNFTASIFANLAKQVDNPDAPTTVDVGEDVISHMMNLHPQHIMKAVDLMANSSWWVSEGFDLKDHPVAMGRVTNWIADAQAVESVSLITSSGQSSATAEASRAMAEMASLVAKENAARHRNDQHTECKSRRAALYYTESSQYFLHHLMGGVAAADAVASEVAERTVNAGMPAENATLEFAKFLSWNASATAEHFQKQSFDYTSMSSSALDSFATQIHGMVAKISGFVRIMEKYSTPAGIAKLEDEIHNFSAKASADMVQLVNRKMREVLGSGAPKLRAAINGAVDYTGHKLGEKVADAVSKPLFEAIKVPVEQVLGGFLNDTEGGIVFGDMLAETVSEKLRKMTGDLIGRKAASFLNESLNDALAHAADLAENSVTKVAAASESLGSSENWFSLLETGQQPIAVGGPTTTHGPSASSIDKEGGLSIDIEGDNGTLPELPAHDAGVDDLHGVFWKIGTKLRTFMKLLPQAIETLKFAKQEVGEVAQTMDTVFSMLDDRGPRAFKDAAQYWRVHWCLYYCCLVPMSLILLYYAFWASGFFGGPSPVAMTGDSSESGSDGGPRTWASALDDCYNACGSWKDHHDHALLFWSCILLGELVCLFIFIASMGLCIFAGVKSFIVDNCSQVYILNDERICSEVMQVLRSFQSTFWVGEWGDSALSSNIDSVCSDNQLLTCHIISRQIYESAILTGIFSFLATILSFQMVIESACLHTQARFRRIITAIADADSDKVRSASSSAGEDEDQGTHPTQAGAAAAAAAAAAAGEVDENAAVEALVR